MEVMSMSMLGALIEVSGEGGNAEIDPLMPMLMVALYLFLILLPILFILGIVFYKKKYQHQQILAAIEKGVPLADLSKLAPRDKEINWVWNLSVGIGFIFAGVLLAVLWLWLWLRDGAYQFRPKFLIIPIIVGGLGLICLLRGILQKSCEKKKARLPKEELV